MFITPSSYVTYDVESHDAWDSTFGEAILTAVHIVGYTQFFDHLVLCAVLERIHLLI